MKLACTGWSFPLCTLEEAAGIARVLGFEAIDAGAYPGGHVDRAGVLGNQEGELRRLRGLGVLVSNLYWTFAAGFSERALNNPDAGIRRQNAHDFRSVVAFCRAAGIPSVMLLPGILHPGQTRSAALECCVAGCRELLPIAQDAGVVIALEPHVMSLLESPNDTLQVVQAVPGIKLALDYGHFLSLGYREEDVDPLCAHAGHFHVRQSKQGFLQTRLEHGTLNYPRILDTLRAVGYDGYLAVEYVHQDYLQTDNVDVISETVKMRNLLKAYL